MHKLHILLYTALLPNRVVRHSVARIVHNMHNFAYTDTAPDGPAPPRPVPLDTVAGPRAAFALKHGLRHEPAFRSFLPPPARRPASAGWPKAGLYVAAIDFRRARFPQSTVSTVVRVAPEVNV